MKYFPLFILGGLLCLLSCGPEIGPQNFEFVHSEIKKSISDQKYHQAIILVNQGLQFAQNHADSAALYYQGHYCHTQLNQLIDAAVMLRLALFCNKDLSQQARFLSAQNHLYYTLGDYELALQSGRAALKIDPSLSDPFLLNNYYRFNALKAAIRLEYFKEANNLLSTFEKEHLTTSNLAALHNETIYLRYLEENYTEAIKLGMEYLNNPTFEDQEINRFWVHTNLGASLINTKRFEEAQFHLSQALEFRPSHPSPLFYSLRLAKLDDTKSVAEYAQKLVSLNRENLMPYQFPWVSEAYRSLILCNSTQGFPTLKLENEANEFDRFTKEKITEVTRELTTTLANADAAENNQKQFAVLRAQQSHEAQLQRSLLLALAIGGVALISLILWGWRWRKRHQRIKNAPPAIPEEIRQAVYELEKSVSILGTPTSGLSRRK